MIRKVTIAIFLLCLPAMLYAESLFLKDGSIIEGKIKKDTDTEVIITYHGQEKSVPRNQVIRVLYTEEYKALVYIFLKDNTIIEGHIVEESRDGYLYRPRLEAPEEKTIKKEDLRFISQEKISLYEMQKKSEKPKLISDRKNKFLNLLGLRLGALYNFTENSGMNVTQGEDVLMDIGLYYIDRFFEFNWDIHFGFGDHGASLHHYTMTFIPFSMFNVELGITIGYTNMEYSKLESTGESEGVSLFYQGLLLGLSYRWGGWFRIGFDYSMPITVDGKYKYNNGMDWIDVNYSKDELAFNCHAFIEIFVWTNMSVRLSYRLLGSRIYTDEFASGNPPPDSITLQNQCISLSIGYGLNLF